VGGFIASWCIVDLLAAGHEVVASVRSRQRERDVLPRSAAIQVRV
jgi:hypothetical protein